MTPTMTVLVVSVVWLAVAIVVMCFGFVISEAQPPRDRRRAA